MENTKVNPCKPDCPLRSATCHAECEAYQLYRERRLQEYEQRAARRAVQDAEAVRGEKIRRDVRERGLDGTRRRR